MSESLPEDLLLEQHLAGMPGPTRLPDLDLSWLPRQSPLRTCALSIAAIRPPTTLRPPPAREDRASGIAGAAQDDPEGALGGPNARSPLRNEGGQLLAQGEILEKVTA